MCGIAGCVATPGTEPDRAALRRMAEALRHRGPDDSGVEVVGSVGLVATRLAIVDPSPAGHAPMRHPDGSWWLTYNGEIFNHAELRAELGERAYRGHSDTETLVHALAAWGEDAIPRCNGLWAFAALDVGRRRLLLVRDRFGVKPLYLARHDGAVWFASEIGALLAAGVPRALDRDALSYSILFAWPSGPVTPLTGVRRVLPGTLVSVNLETLASEERRWYDPCAAVDAERQAELARRPRRELVAAVEDELRSAVRRRLMADVPLGTMCSGGLDSGLVTALADQAAPGIVAYNASISDQPDDDEGPYAERVAAGLGVELRTVRMTAESWCGDLVGVVAHNEYPLTHESSVPMMAIAALAHADGVKVLLSGEGADELFGGYGHMHLRLYLDYLRARRRLATGAALVGAKLRRDGMEGILRLLRSRHGAIDSRLRMGQFPGLHPADGAARFDQDWTARASAAYAHHEEPRRRLEAELLRELGTYLPHLLNRQDKNTMQRSIETRVPFLDPGLVSLALNLPLEARMEPARKAPLRELGRRLLPAGIAERQKKGFGFDVRRYIDPRARGEFLRDGILRETFEAPAAEWGAAVEAADGAQALLLWTGEIWCRLFVAGETVSTVERELWG